MSEYWKSTPKYWCKHCKLFVRDTKLERQNHDATPRHQGNLKRFLRDLHRGHEKEEKDKERAKSEVARLNGLVSGSGVAGSSSSSSSRFGRGPSPSAPKSQATQSQRKQQLAQLAEMGVSIPDEFRGEMAMAGDWRITSERLVDPSETREKPPEAIGFGVRKRAVVDEEEEAEAKETKKRRWGSAFRNHPVDDDADLDSLLSCSRVKASAEPEIKRESFEGASTGVKDTKKNTLKIEDNQKPTIKRELSDGRLKVPETPALSTEVDIKNELDAAAGGVLFKKRRAKNIRQK